VRVTPRAGRDEISHIDDAGTLHLRVTAAPADGKANAAATRVLAGALGIAPSRVRLLSGGASRSKLFEVDGSAELASLIARIKARP
jgi:uncharacterized protein YggU (UPF0235/DUF167 family)